MSSMEENFSINFVKIQDLTKDIKTASLIARIYNFSKIIEFQKKDGSKGRVVNINLSDGTGTIKLVLWDKQTAVVEEGNINLGDVIQIVNGFVKESTFDSNLEIIPGKYTSINIVENENDEIPTLEEILKKTLIQQTPRSEISNLTSGFFEVKGTVVQTIKGKNIFYSCPICGGKMIIEDNKFRCNDHGDLEGQPVIVFNIILDDSTGSIGVVFFRNVAEKALGINTDNFNSMSDDERNNLIAKTLSGKEVIVTGNVKRNKFFDRTEIIATDIKNINPLEESKKLIENIEGLNDLNE